MSAADDIATHHDELALAPQTERESIVKARVGQGRFREDLLELWAGCAVTGLPRPELLRASHIKPWRRSNNAERLNRFNGLLLLPQYDHLFDRGYITFDRTGKLEASPAITSLPAKLLGIDMNARLRRLAEEHSPFLEYHSSKVFISKSNRD